MTLDRITIGELSISRFMLGSNPFSGFSHQGVEADERMIHYYTTARIKQTLREAEAVGINMLIARADHHVMRLLMEYWDEGGTLQWIAQTCPELGPIEEGVANAIKGGACACYVHGGVTDYLLAQGKTDEIPPALAMIHDAGLPAGIAGHNPAVFRWAEETGLDADFYMCCYYNPSSRDENAEHVHGAREWFREEDRAVMVETIAGLSRPAIHYKVLAAGRNDPAEAFAFVAQHLRPQDAVCVGVCTEDRSDMLREDVALLERAMASRSKKPRSGSA